MPATPEIPHAQAIAYRLDAQGLCDRAGADQMAATARAVCVQNTAPGAAGQALAARIAEEAITEVLDGTAPWSGTTSAGRPASCSPTASRRRP